MNISLMEPIGVPEEMIDSLAERLKKEGHVLRYNKLTASPCFL